jgi:hypothetical protein
MFAFVGILAAIGVASLHAGPPPVTQGLKAHYDANDLNNGGNPAQGAAITIWRDISGNAIDATTGGLTAPAISLISPIYHTNVLNGRAGVNFSGSLGDGLASAFSGQLDFTNATILVVANRSDSSTHVAVSGPTVQQEFIVANHALYHHSSSFHWSQITHSSPPLPAAFYIHAGLFGKQHDQFVNYINGVPSTNILQYGQEPVADYIPTSRQVVLGWRNSGANGVNPYSSENFGGILCEVLIYDRQLSAAEVDAMNNYLGGKYGISVTVLSPPLKARLASPGLVELSWEAAAGRLYQIQSTTNLAPANWLDVGVPIPGTGVQAITNLPTTIDPQKFYRLKVTN